MADVPPTVVTVMSTVAAACAGDVAVIWPSVSTLKDAALTTPNFTELAPVKCEPLIVTDVPPALGPAVGFSDVTVGASTKVKRSKNDVTDVPAEFVTVTSTWPAAWAGEVAVMWVASTTLTEVPAAPYIVNVNVTAVKPKVQAIADWVGPIDVTLYFGLGQTWFDA